MRILFVGDIHGKPGRRILKALLGTLRREHEADLVIANGENAAGGSGLTRETAAEIFAAGVDVITGGNHIWQHAEARELLDGDPRILRPANYPPGAPGGGTVIALDRHHRKVGVLNLEGRVFMHSLEDPFRVGEREAERLRQETPVVIVDFHAEATSEKAALAWYLDGKVSAVLGTHTHVQTADGRVLPGGTAFISDVGMTGPRDGIIGMGRKEVLERFLSQLPVRFQVESGPAQLNAAVVDVDEQTGRARQIRALFLVEDRARRSE